MLLGIGTELMSVILPLRLNTKEMARTFHLWSLISFAQLVPSGAVYYGQDTKEKFMKRKLEKSKPRTKSQNSCKNPQLLI